MLGYFSVNGDVRIVLSPADSATLNSRGDVEGVLFDPRSRRKRELYGLRLEMDDEKSGGAITTYPGEREHRVYVSSWIVERMKDQGHVWVSTGSKAVELREATTDEASLLACV